MIRGQPRFVLELGSIVLLVGFCLFWFSDTIADPDLWGHIRFGQDIIKNGSAVQSDIYSYRTRDQRWINHEWLSEVIFAGLHDLAGARGLIVFKLVISIVLIMLSYVHLRRRGAGRYVSVLLLILLSVPFRMGLGTIRPQIFTYLCFFLELLILEKGAGAGQAWLWLLPVLLAFWVNLHGGVLAGVGVLFVWIAVRVIARRHEATPFKQTPGSMLQIGLIGLASCAALLINPYGIELVWFLLRTGTVPRPEILEWVPLALLSLPGQLYLGLLMIGIAGLVGSRRRRARRRS